MGDDMTSNAYSKREFSIVGVIITGTLIIAAFAMAWLYLRDAHNNPLSDDAVIGANLVNIAATVPGRIVSIAVQENQSVKKGDMLFSIDPKPLRLLVEQTTADLAIAEAALDSQRRAVKAESQNALIAGQQVARARTNLDLAEATLKRLEALGPKGYVTRQQIDDARTVRNDAQISLIQARKQAEAADVLVGTLDSAQALVRARQAALALAQHNLDNSVVRSPTMVVLSVCSTAPGRLLLRANLFSPSSTHPAGLRQPPFQRPNLPASKWAIALMCEFLPTAPSLSKARLKVLAGVSRQRVLSTFHAICPMFPKPQLGANCPALSGAY